MDRELRDEWITALRSGDYKQGHGALRQDTLGGVKTFCCLGVLCDLADPEGWRPPISGDDCPAFSYVYENSPSKSLVPNSLAEAIDLSNDAQWELVRLNDGQMGNDGQIGGHGASFSTIADHIERNL